jgi:hypothetical protein
MAPPLPSLLLAGHPTSSSGGGEGEDCVRGAWGGGAGEPPDLGDAGASGETIVNITCNFNQRQFSN